MTEIRTRREPPAFRAVEVARVERRTPFLVRLTLQGAELAGLEMGLPAGSLRLLLPRAGGALEVPTWRGNEFLLADGSRPVIRTLTPIRLDAGAPELDVEVVLHGEAPLSTWASAVEPGGVAAVSGMGRGYEIDPRAPSYLLAGDESAVPAIGVLLAALPQTATVAVLVEVRSPEARSELPAHAGVTVTWVETPAGARIGEALGDAVAAAEVDGSTKVWAAGEASAVQRIRRHLFEDRGLSRSQAVVRGYWKVGRGGDAEE